MILIEVNRKKGLITIDNQTCNFIEAGLQPNGKKITDEGEIEEHFYSRYESDIENGVEIDVFFIN